MKKSMAANASTGIVNCRLGVCQDLLLVNVFIEAIFLKINPTRPLPGFLSPST